MKIKIETSQGKAEMHHDSPTTKDAQNFIMKEFKYASDVRFYVYVNDNEVDAYEETKLNDGDTVMFMDLGDQV